MGSRYRDSSDSDEDRGRSSSKRKNSQGLSGFYRERFGSHSPEEYMNLRISGFDEKLEREEIKDILSKEFRDFRPFEIKVVRQPGDDERLAYVNFEKRDCAKKVRYSYMERLRKSLGKRILCDPAGILRDQEGKYIPDRFNRQLQGIDREQPKRRSPDRGRSAPKQPNVWRLKENDSDATRTLFVGNMVQDIRESEIRKAFERYGSIEDIDIKTPANTDAAYAFIMFQTLEQSIDAKHGLHDRAIRSGGPRCKIGYGKSQVSRRLWVGGLGHWASTDMLSREFDRYGLIEKLDYEDGDEFGYIRFADANAAQDAFKGMKNFPLGGKNRCIIVDFAKDDTVARDPLNHIGGTHLGHSRKRRAETPPNRTPPGSPKGTISTFDQLDDEYANTWQGQILLKKTEYSVRMYRIAGAEKLLQKWLRDEDGNALRLHIQQRLSLSNQENFCDRLLAQSSKEIAVMVAVGKQLSELKPLVKYLHEKNAGGVVVNDESMLYLFPSSEMTSRLMSRFGPNIRLLNGDSSFLLAVLTPKPSSTHSSPR